MTNAIMHCAVCGADEASTYLGAPGPGIVRCFAVGCDAQVGGYATDEEAIAEWNRRAVAMDEAMTEAYCTSDDNLGDYFRHHITTTIGWLAFGARPGPEMQMYEEGFKAGYRRCQSDNEPELGEEEDALSDRARMLVEKLRESIKSGAVQLADVEDAIDLIVEQSASQDAGTPAYWVRFRLSDGKATFWETEVPDGFPLYRRTPSPQPREVG